MGLSMKAAKLALAAVLAVGLCPGFAFAAQQPQLDVQAGSLAVSAVDEIAYAGDAVALVKDDLTSEFGMLSDRSNSMKASLADGKVHLSWTPSNKTVYKGFYLKADIAESATWLEDNFIAMTEESTYDFELDESYCGYAWPIAPVKASDETVTTSSQYYLAIPAKESFSAAELAVENSVRMLRVSKAELVKANSTLILTMGSSAYGKLFVGTQSEADASPDQAIAFNEADMTFTVPVSAHLDGEPFVVQMWSNNNEQWYERQFTIDAKAMKLVIEPVPEPVVDTSKKMMFRLYNPNSSEHFYTSDAAEKNDLVGIGWNYERVGWIAPGENKAPVYRLYNEAGGEHHYTTDADEKDYLVSVGWKDENIGWYSDEAKTVPLYRDYNPNAFANNHNYTTDKDEHDALIAAGWHEEGYAWYGVQPVAAYVDELIADIQVQTRTENTDAQCAAAKDAWDALSEDQKEQVEEGDYFALDTGDASADDPRNANEIGEKEILVVSFGTSFNDSRVATIGAVEKAIAEANPDWSVRRAFTAQIIINHIQARDGEVIDNMDQALDRAVANGVKTLVVAPTHLMHGAEYDELVKALEPYQDKFAITVAEPLLGQVGEDATVINADKEAVAKAVVAAAVADAGYDDLAAAEADGVAFVFMGHGTEHSASITYDQMQTQMNALGYENVFIGTVEGEPEDTECSAVIAKVKEAGYKKVILRPLMVVAGDHANNDMADPEDEESWVSQFTASGAFDTINCQIKGLGEIADIQKIYVAHVADALAAE